MSTHFISPTTERRFSTGPVELRGTDGTADTPPLVRGYAALFDTPSGDLGGFREVIARGAFDGVPLTDVVCLFNHNPDLILARSAPATGAGGPATLSLGVDERGLWYEFTPPNSSHGQTLIEALRRGDIGQSSFAFTVAKDGDLWASPSDGPPEYEAGNTTQLRTITRIERLYDVSPVTYPAYPDTTVALRSLAARSQTTAQPESPAAESPPPAAETADPYAAVPAATRVELGLI